MNECGQGERNFGLGLDPQKGVILHKSMYVHIHKNVKDSNAEYSQNMSTQQEASGFSSQNKCF